MKSRKELTQTLREACAEVDTWQPWQRSRDPEGDAVTNQSKPAPTAEEQLAERISEIESRLAAATPGPWEKDLPEDGFYIFTEDARMVCEIRGFGSGLPQQANQDFIAAAPEDIRFLLDSLTAALRSNREKDAKFTELERRGMWDCDEYTSRETKRHVETLEAQLRAVSEALKEKLAPLPRVMDTWSAGRVMAADQVEEWRDDFVARLRSIVDGKD